MIFIVTTRARVLQVKHGTIASVCSSLSPSIPGDHCVFEITSASSSAEVLKVSTPEPCKLTLSTHSEKQPLSNQHLVSISYSLILPHAFIISAGLQRTMSSRRSRHGYGHGHNSHRLSTIGEDEERDFRRPSRRDIEYFEGDADEITPGYNVRSSRVELPHEYRSRYPKRSSETSCCIIL